MNDFTDSCTAIDGNLPLYAGGDLEPAALASIEEHLRACAACEARARAALVARRALIAGLERRAGRVPDLWPGIRAVLVHDGLITRTPMDLAPVEDGALPQRRAAAILPIESGTQALAEAARSTPKSRRWIPFSVAAAAAVLFGFWLGRVWMQSSAAPRGDARSPIIVPPNQNLVQSVPVVPGPIQALPVRQGLHRLLPGEVPLGDSAEIFGADESSLFGLHNPSDSSPASFQRVQPVH